LPAVISKACWERGRKQRKPKRETGKCAFMCIIKKNEIRDIEKRKEKEK
jgi:hypothetical protein